MFLQLKSKETQMSTLRKLAMRALENPTKVADAFETAGYTDPNEVLKVCDYHDSEERHIMRQQKGYDPVACRVVEDPANDDADESHPRPIVVINDTRKLVRENRNCESQAPPTGGGWVCAANDLSELAIGRAA
jgi:hypothetical protein